MLSTLPLDTLSAGLAIVIIAISWQFIQSIYTAFRADLWSVPGPITARFTPLWRAIQIARGDAPAFYRRLHQQYGPIVRTAPNVVDISDPKAMPVIYGINSRFLKSAFHDVFHGEYENEAMPTMFSERDPIRHQQLRRPVASKFSMSSIKAMEPFADDCTEQFCAAMKDMEGQVVDLGEWLQWYAFDVIGCITFQRCFGFMKHRRDVGGMIGALESAFKYLATIAQIPNYHGWLMGNRRVANLAMRLGMKNPLRTIVEFTQECIQDYDQEPAEKHQGRPDFLAWCRSGEEKGTPMPVRDIVNICSSNLLAGSDTTAISLRAIIYFLMQHPTVYRKLQSEIDGADRAGQLSLYVTYAEGLELPYLQAVMKEAMRCHPSVSFPLERVVPVGGMNLADTFLRAGTIVGMNPAVIHHDTSIFGKDAASFRPERWTDSSKEEVKTMDRYLLTFGYGTRTCIGKNISIMEMGKLIPQIMRQFDFEWASVRPTWRVQTYWFSKQHGLKCRLRSRK